MLENLSPPIGMQHFVFGIFEQSLEYEDLPSGLQQIHFALSTRCWRT